MTLADRLTRCPRPFDPERGADVAAAYDGLAPELLELIIGTAGSSPYLAGLLAREPEWLRPALFDPEGALDAVVSGLPDTGDLAGPLRQAKRRVALLLALADLGGAMPLDEVTGQLTRFADAAVDKGMHALLVDAIERGKLPGVQSPDQAGLFALAMGKMGAGELNYSSDIDLICLFDETLHDVDDFQDVRSGLIGVTRKLAGLLGDVTAEGYVFRTDLRLRPDASVTPVCVSMDAAERYYESVGRTWERAAYIKARVAAGDMGAGARFLDTLTPFVWRRHLDFAAIQDAQDMRLKIRTHKGLHGAISLEGHDMKLGQGGIREIEFFAQTHQLISGGRDPSLRVRGTCDALQRLAEAGRITPQLAADLTVAYIAHREVEHRLQMVGDAQTHSLPKSPEGFARLAALMGQDLNALRASLTTRLTDVSGSIDEFFAPEAKDAVQTDFGDDTVARWRTYPALRSTRGAEIFDRLRPGVMARLQEAERPEEALAQFDGFLAGLPAGVQLFSLFEANPSLVDLIVDICRTAPRLAQYLSRHAQVLDAVLDGGFFSPWPGRVQLRGILARELAEASDYEAALDRARVWFNEWHFRIGVHHLRGLIGSDEAGRQYADLAGAVVAGLWPVVGAEFSRRYGRPPGLGAVVLGMGSLGAGRLHAASDLDLIVIYDPLDVTESDGKRSLTSGAYYAKLTQALVTAVSALTAEGKIYEVDMRLRPSGRQGPVATGIASFERYQTEEAWTWEHLALTRARVVAGDAQVARRVERFRRGLIKGQTGAVRINPDLAEMRARIAAAKGEGGTWGAKIGAGRLQDIELFAQGIALRTGSAARLLADQLQAGVAAEVLDRTDADALSGAAELFWKIQGIRQLLSVEGEAPLAGGRRMLLRETGFRDLDDLETEIAAQAARAAAIITARLKETSP